MPDAPLAGTRILIVEDEAAIAFDLQAILSDAGAEIVGPAATLARAQALAESDRLSAAILDVQIGSMKVFPIAALLADRSVPFAFHTGHVDGDGLASTWPDVEVINKPATRTMIVAALSRLVHGKG